MTAFVFSACESTLVVTERLLRPGAGGRFDAGMFVEIRAIALVGGELECTLVRALGLRVRAQLGGALGGAGQHVAGRPLDLFRVVGVGRRPPGVEVMRGDDLDDLVLIRPAPEGRQVPRRGEVLLLPLALRERLVGDVLDDVQEKRVLAALR
jgi:hypothetical protein